MADTKRTVHRTITTTVTLTEDEYKAILRKAVDAPATADVEIEDTYGGNIVIRWTSYEDNVDG